MKLPLFIHGWAFSSKVFFPFTGIKPDLPAHGGSNEIYTDLDKTVAKLALTIPDKRDVVGWSLGGSLAILLAFKFPEKVKRLFLIGTSPFFGKAWPEENLRAFKIMIRKKGVSAFRSMVIPNFKDRIEEKYAMKMLEDYINLDLRDIIPVVKKEVFILQGEKDPIVPVKEAFILHSLFKRSKLIILPGGHFPAEDERAVISSLLKSS